MRPQISLKLIFCLFFYIKKVTILDLKPPEGVLLNTFTGSERRKGLLSGSRGGIKFFPWHKYSRCETFWCPGGFLSNWVVIVEGDKLDKIKLLVRLRKQLRLHHVFSLSGILFHHWEYWTLKPSNISEAPQPGHIQHCLFSNNWRWNTSGPETEPEEWTSKSFD